MIMTIYKYFKIIIYYIMELASKSLKLRLFQQRGPIYYITGDNGGFKVDFKLLGDEWELQPSMTKPVIKIVKPFEENSRKILEKLNENEIHTGDTLIIKNDRDFEYIDPDSPKINDPILKGGIYKRKKSRKRGNKKIRRNKKTKRYRKRY